MAKYIARLDTNRTIPGTNDKTYENLVFSKSNTTKGFACLDFKIHKVLPIPRSNVPFEVILDFKKKRHKELKKFQQIVTVFQKELSNTESADNTKEIISKYSSQVKLSLTELKEVLREDKIETISGTMKALVNLKNIGYLGLLNYALNKLPNPVEVPLKIQAAGLAIAGSIDLSHHFIQRNHQKNARLRNSTVAYLYQAERSGIVQRVRE